ncbi:hypothetical protein GDO81_002157 [Engystomops pustulosus]|uniref:Sfi1 spindle body domain-containing protein n=1 Tax=Engystomops pustulosus TaxID=76066 RepID=A0AAV7DHT0_ENGPU|nr:hypothetical protein GDO81_002157 [Engystomops pustulosus]KAG8597065.1 hypothetical protein GDO81_002157 [Engystomops pustulosus]
MFSVYHMCQIPDLLILFLQKSVHYAFKKNVLLVHSTQQRKLQAADQYHSSLLYRFWATWQRRIEQKEEDELLSLTNEANRHYRSVVLQKYFNFWIQYKQQRKIKKVLAAASDSHYVMCLLPQSFQKWRKQTCLKQKCRDMEYQASKFFSFCVQRRVLSTWITRLQQQKETRLAERMAILHCDSRLMEQYWCAWKGRLAELQTERETIIFASQHYCTRQLYLAFHIWREHVENIKSEQFKAGLASCHYQQLCKRNVWSRWRLFVVNRQHKRQMLLCADEHHQLRLLRRALDAWKCYHGNIQNVLQAVARKEVQHKKLILQDALNTWKNQTAAQIGERIHTDIADHHYRKRILKKILPSWRQAAYIQACNREQTSTEVEVAVGRLQKGKLCRIFLYWREHTQTMKQERLKMEIAAGHHARRLLKICVTEWKVYHTLCLRKMLLQRQQMVLYGRRLCLYHLRRWKQSLLEKRQQDKQTVQALWHWSINLQGKVFDYWLAYVHERHRKKQRIAKAVEVYRTDLLRDGVSRILQFMSGMKHFRCQLSTQNLLKEVHIQNVTVRRFAMIWKEKVFKKRPQNLPQKKVTFQLPVTHVQTQEDLVVESVTDKFVATTFTGGEPTLSTVHATRRDRLKPRTPDFLLQSLEREGLLEAVVAEAESKIDSSTRNNTEKHTSCMNSLPELEINPNVAANVASEYTSLHQGPSPATFLRSPWFMQGLEKQEDAKTRNSHPADLQCSHYSGSKQFSDYSSRLLSPIDFLQGTRVRNPPPADLPEESKDLTKTDILDRTPLDKELSEIQQILEQYRHRKQELRTWHKHALVLKGWLDAASSDVDPDEQITAREVKMELQQLEEQIKRREQKLSVEKVRVQNYVQRIQEIATSMDLPINQDVCK